MAASRLQVLCIFSDVCQQRVFCISCFALDFSGKPMPPNWGGLNWGGHHSHRRKSLRTYRRFYRRRLGGCQNRRCINDAARYRPPLESVSVQQARISNCNPVFCIASTSTVIFPRALRGAENISRRRSESYGAVVVAELLPLWQRCAGCCRRGSGRSTCSCSLLGWLASGRTSTPSRSSRCTASCWAPQ